jgi:hypothetical protein
MRILRDLVEHGGMIAMIVWPAESSGFFASNVPAVMIVRTESFPVPE